MSLPGHDPLLQAIVERICAIIGRLPGDVAALARVLGVAEENLRRLDHPEHRPDSLPVIDLVAALVHEFAIDPQWLLSGQYDATAHGRALGLGEDRSHDGALAIRRLVTEQYRRLRDGPRYLTLPKPLTESE